MFDQSLRRLPALCFIRCCDSILEVADDFGSSTESLTVVLIFSPKPPAFEVGPRGIAPLHFSNF